MRIIVCVKQVPAVHEVSIDPETKRLRREGVVSAMNPFDLYAVEAAVQLCEDLGGTVTVLCMGPQQAERTVREALALGAGRGVLLCDRAFAGSDTWATSLALATAVRHVGGADLVICGKQAVDGDTAQVGPGIAGHLGWPQATCVSRVLEATAARISVRRMHEDGYTAVELTLPAVLTVVKGLNQPRVPKLRDVLNARRATVEVLTAEAIGVAPASIGLGGSPTRVVRTFPPPPRKARTVLIEGSAGACAERLLRELRMQSLV